jgi:hypothetical protein
LNAKKEEVLKDINYVKHFPGDKKYISLYGAD